MTWIAKGPRGKQAWKKGKGERGSLRRGGPLSPDVGCRPTEKVSQGKARGAKGGNTGVQ